MPLCLFSDLLGGWLRLLRRLIQPRRKLLLRTVRRRGWRSRRSRWRHGRLAHLYERQTVSHYIAIPGGLVQFRLAPALANDPLANQFGVEHWVVHPVFRHDRGLRFHPHWTRDLRGFLFEELLNRFEHLGALVFAG